MSRIFFALLLFFAFGCGHRSPEGESHKGHKCDGGCAHHHASGGEKMSCDMAHGASVPSAKATAVVSSLGKSKIKGDVTFTVAGEDLKVVVSMSGLKPNQKQGFHIHEFGNCSAKDGSSAGGHLNPTKGPHAGATEVERHLGDLGNLIADAKGNVVTEIVAPKTRLSEVLGRAVVVHAQEDDLKTQPSGASGDRLACGVIGLTQ